MAVDKFPRAFYVALGAVLVLPLALAFAIRAASTTGQVFGWALAVILLGVAFVAQRQSNALGLLTSDERGKRPAN